MTAYGKGAGTVRFVIELSRTASDRVEGTLGREDGDEWHEFSGWLGLLTLLDSAEPLEEDEGQEVI